MGSALAAVVSEKSDEFLQDIHPCPVNHEPPLGPGLHQARMAELLEMKRERRRRYRQALRDLPCRQAVRRELHQQAEKLQAGFLGQCPKYSQRAQLFHVFNFIEMIECSQHLVPG